MTLNLTGPVGWDRFAPFGRELWSVKLCLFNLQENQRLASRLEEGEQLVWKLKWREAEERQRRVDSEEVAHKLQEVLALLVSPQKSSLTATIQCYSVKSSKPLRIQAACLPRCEPRQDTVYAT